MFLIAYKPAPGRRFGMNQLRQMVREQHPDMLSTQDIGELMKNFLAFKKREESGLRGSDAEAAMDAVYIGTSVVDKVSMEIGKP